MPATPQHVLGPYENVGSCRASVISTLNRLVSIMSCVSTKLGRVVP